VTGLVCALVLLVGVAGCRPVHDNPKLQWAIFDHLGREGIKENVTLEELEGDYKGTIYYVSVENISEFTAEAEQFMAQMLRTEYEGLGTVYDNTLTLTLNLPDGMVRVLTDLPPFELEEGIITAPILPAPEAMDESYLEMVCVAKVYPEGLMLDGVLTTEIRLPESTVLAVMLEFQLVK
jgi:hypothetical protein